jgi:hypothetical protein
VSAKSKNPPRAKDTEFHREALGGKKQIRRPFDFALAFARAALRVTVMADASVLGVIRITAALRMTMDACGYFAE